MPTSKRKSKKEKEKEKEEEAEVTPEATKPSIEPVVLQLAILPNRIDALMEVEEIPSVLEYTPHIVDPLPYHPFNKFASENDVLVGSESGAAAASTMAESASEAAAATAVPETPKENHGSSCYWCCHAIDHMEFGMPIRYDVYHKSFTMFGCFCSLECVAAYNYSVHMGSDRVWEIHSWIQMLASRYGYQGNVRPAPSRYALRMFNGPMSIEEFRNAHKTLARTYIMNIPPFIHVNSQMEVLNTSFLDSSDGVEKVKQPKRKAAAAPHKAIETKLPPTFVTA